MATKKKKSETVTENLLRNFYGATTFVEKSAISDGYGFSSKKGTDYAGYPDFFLEEEDYCIVVEAKAIDHKAAQEEALFYAINNKIHKDIIGIAVSGQKSDSLRVSYYLKLCKQAEVKTFPQADIFLTRSEIKKAPARLPCGRF